MSDRFISFNSDGEEDDVQITNKSKLYTSHLLKMMNQKKILVVEYNFMKNLYENLSLPKLKYFKEIVNKINSSDYKEKDIFFESLDGIFGEFNILDLTIDNIVEDFMIKTVDFKLTDDQQLAANNLYNFIYNDNNIYLLKGFAGTGKTSIISELVCHMVSSSQIKSIVFSAPTNKAVNVIKSKFLPIFNTKNIEHATVDFHTIHKLLEYKTDYDIHGNIIFVRKNIKKSLFQNYDLVIIDECSMLSKDLVYDIKNEGINENKIILIGDPAQLPPVDEEESEIFRLKEIEANNMLMKQVIRSTKGNIVGICNNVRKWTFGEISDPQLGSFANTKDKIKSKVDYNNGVKLYKNKYNHKIHDSREDYIKTTKWMKSFLQNDNGIILAWTNKRCDMYNKIARQSLYKKIKLNRFEIGDRLILSDFYVAKNYESNETFYTSEQIKIVDIMEKTIRFPEMEIEYPKYIESIKNHIHIKSAANKTIKEINNKTSRFYDVYMLQVVKNGESNTYTLYILKDESIGENILEKNLASTKISELIKFFQTYYREQFPQIEKYIVRKIWKAYNQTFVEPFANVNYGFSCTVHKSQASSFNNVYVDSDDILNNPKNEEAKRCTYTAMTRAIDELHILL